MNQRRHSDQRFVAKMLFTDIVGSTDLAVKLGDRQWQALLVSHHAAVRRELRRFRGREVDTAGDGFFATFEQPTQALHAAEAIVAAVAELGVGIRVGLHAGEAEAGKEKMQGIAVHIASRVMSAARPGEVLVSGTLRDLVAGSGFEFSDRGLHDLKGLPGEWHLWALGDAAHRGHPEGAGDSRPSLPLPEKPSIAVLPFTNLSGDPEDDYFADGMVEDIITGLCRINWIFVIARNSSFVYKGKTGSVAELAPPVRSDVETHLAALVRQELIRPDSSVFAGDEAFRFRHILIRDAAYESLPKATRAQLHEQFANWLEGQALIERDEILGYHLEQAHRYRRELDPEAAELPSLAGRAAEHLAGAGRAALDRGDARAAQTLLERATAVLPQHDDRRFAHTPELADVYQETAVKRAFEILTEARSADDPITRARAAVRLGRFDLERPSEMAKVARAALREEARAVFEAEGYDLGLAEYWRAEAEERWAAARAAETAEACEHALFHFEQAGAAQSHIGQRTRNLLLRTYIYSPMPVDHALVRVTELSRDDDGPLIRAAERIVIGTLLSMKGELSRARELVGGARQTFTDAGLLVSARRGTFEADIEIRAGDWQQAERILRDAFDGLEELGEHSYSSTIAAVLAMVLVSQRELAAARDALDHARQISVADDLINSVVIELAEGRLLAYENRLAEAEAVGRRAVELADRIDFCFTRPLAHSYLAETLALAGKPEEATHHATTALAILEAKGDVMLAARVREQLAAAGVGHLNR